MFIYTILLTVTLATGASFDHSYSSNATDCQQVDVIEQRIRGDLNFEQIEYVEVSVRCSIN